MCQLLDINVLLAVVLHAAHDQNVDHFEVVAGYLRDVRGQRWPGDAMAHNFLVREHSIKRQLPFGTERRPALGVAGQVVVVEEPDRKTEDMGCGFH